MKPVNSYFQKASIIFIVIMLLVILNLHAYSAVGSYQTVSMAITANESYQPLVVNDDLFETRSVTINDINSRYDASRYNDHQSIFDVLGADDLKAIIGHFASGSKHIVKDYTKYDFSGFDN